jgi:glycosyltransferase involved in cell wall biosynthesis
MKQMNIILVNKFYPPHTERGGIATYHRVLGAALMAHGHHVQIIAARYSPAQADSVDENGIVVHREQIGSIPPWWRLRGLRRFVHSRNLSSYSYAVSGRIARLKQTKGPTVVEFADYDAEARAYLTQKKRHPVVIRCHVPTFVLNRYFSRKELPFDFRRVEEWEKWCIRHADAISAPSLAMARLIESETSLSSGTVAVIPNPVDVAYYRSATLMRQIDANRFRVLFVGRLDRLKGAETMIQAIPDVLTRVKDIQVLLAGPDVSDRGSSTWGTRLRAELEQRGVRHRVDFLGDLDRGDLLKAYANADIAIVPSLYESFSYTAVQAMAAGLPVIASAVGGLPETIEDVGLMIPPGDSEALAEAILRLAGDPALRAELSFRAELQSRKFDMSVVTDRMVGFYQRVLAASSPQSDNNAKRH